MLSKEQAQQLIKAAENLINEARSFSVSGVYFTELDYNLEALLSLEFEIDALKEIFKNVP